MLGFVCSRLLFVFTDDTSRASLSLDNVLNVHLGGFSMSGALMGAVAGVALGAAVSGKKAGGMLDALAPGLMLFVCVARLGEWGGSDIGWSRELRNTESFFATSFMCEDGYIRVFLLEVIAAFLIMLVLLMQGGKNRRGFVFLRGMILYGAVQTLLESLRHDGHMRFSFVGVQHILSYVFLLVAVVLCAVLCIRAARHKGSAVSAIVICVLVAALCLVLEFFVDGNQQYIGLNVESIDREIVYAIYGALLAFSAAVGLALTGLAEKVSRSRH